MSDLIAILLVLVVGSLVLKAVFKVAGCLVRSFILLVILVLMFSILLT